MKFRRNILLSLLASLAVIGALTTAVPARAQAGPHAVINRIVAFGASLTDTGNAFIWFSEPANQICGTRLNVPPYDALDDLLIPSGPYARGGHHFTNGATWIEGLAQALALSGNARPAFQNTGMKASNYAVGGARAVADFDCRFNLPKQISTYVGEVNQSSAGTLVAIEIGGNDVRDALVAAANRDDPAPYIKNALTSLSNGIVTLYGHGAQKFLVLNVPDIGKTPAVRALGPTAVAVGGALSDAYNKGLANAVADLGKAGIKVTILDVYATLNDIVANPGNYGFVNATDACITPNQPPYTCARPDTYVFWDGIHPTKALHAIVAQRALAAISAP
jgi:phospholipase/lecithinase/hemolysin